MAKYIQMHKESLFIFFKGLLMGTADIIPGVSGGTIAFITGIYDRLIEAIGGISFKHLRALAMMIAFPLSLEKRKKSWTTLKEIDWMFLLPLGAGIICAILTLARVIPYLMATYPVATYSFFFGLIAFSARVPFREMERRPSQFFILLLCFVASFLLLGGQQSMSGTSDTWFVFFSGAIAVCALILPGISGSYILVMMGQYKIVLEAVHDRNFLFLGVFILGMMVGLFSFVRFLKFLLENYRSQTMAALTGIMLGSLRVIWPMNYAIQVDGSVVGLSIGFVVLGCVAVYGLERSAFLRQSGRVLN